MTWSDEIWTSRLSTIGRYGMRSMLLLKKNRMKGRGRENAVMRREVNGTNAEWRKQTQT